MELTRKLWPFSGLSRFCRTKPRLPIQGSLFEASIAGPEQALVSRAYFSMPARLNRRTGYVISRSLVTFNTNNVVIVNMKGSYSTITMYMWGTQHTHGADSHFQL